jgi:hypothetical protein
MRERLVSIETAQHTCGVVIAPMALRINEAATRLTPTDRTISTKA